MRISLTEWRRKLEEGFNRRFDQDDTNCTKICLCISLSLKDQTILHIEGQNCLAKIQEILNILSLHSASCHEPHGHTWLSQGIELLSDLTYLC